MNYFVTEPEQYTRKMDMKGAYVENIAFFLSRTTGKDMGACRSYVQKNIGDDGKFPFVDPAVIYLARDKVTGDRSRQITTFGQYLQTALEKNQIIVPTLTTYMHPSERKSLLANYINRNLQKRKMHKKQMLVSKQAGDSVRAAFENNLQNSCKIKNNSLSGAHSSPFTILYNRSSHSTLTSTCRITTSYGNANNEKFLAGNRHYWAPFIVLSDILTIVQNADYPALQLAMDAYKLAYPTPEQAMECIRYSSDLYWIEPTQDLITMRLLNGLTPLELAAYVYSGDAYHLAKYNPEPVRALLDDFTTVIETPVDSPATYMDNLSEDEVALVSQLCARYTAGIDLYKLKSTNPEHYATVAANAKHLTDTLSKHQVLIRAVMRPTTLHGSVAKLPFILRRAVIASDTDSTIFTTQNWVEWYCGRICFTPTAFNVAYVMSFLTSQVVIHLLAMMSANLGVERAKLNELAMKNEYFFPMFTLTPRAKHYFASKSSQEGKVFLEYEQEIKGVALRSSNAPPEINERLRLYMIEIQELVMRDGNVSIHDLLDPIAEIEHSIIATIANGEHRFLRSVPVKDVTSYVEGNNAPALIHHRMWEEVFAPKYGHSIPPPYQAVKVSVELDNPTKLKRWLDGLEDRALAERLSTFLIQNRRDRVAVMMFPKPMVEMIGIPPEVRNVITIRKLIHDIMSPYYLVLEAFGLYMMNGNHTRLVSDHWAVNKAPIANDPSIVATVPGI